MDEQNPTGVQSPLNIPTGIHQEPEVPQEEGIPWLKYGMVLFFAMAIINLGLFYFYLSGNKKPQAVEERVDVKDEEGFSITKPEQTISKEGYSITFSNPRYEHLENQSAFRVDVALANESFIPSVKIIANCDLSENGVLVKEGEGVSIESGESSEITPGGSASWTALVILENQNQQVTSCLYAPEGVFDPRQSVKVIF